MARTVPAALKAIPVKMAPEMCARGGMLVKVPSGIAIGRDLTEALAYDPALSGLQFIRRSDFARRHILCQIFKCGAVFHHPVLGGL